MRFQNIIFLALTLILTQSAWADPVAPTTLVDLFANSNRDNLGSFGAGVEFNQAYGDVPRFWVSAEYRGAQLEGGQSRRILFAVDGRMAVIGSEFDGRAAISGADVQFIPLQIGNLLSNPEDPDTVAIYSHRILPMSYKRDINIGIDESLSISAYGLQGEMIQQFEHLPKLQAFVRFAVDAVGYQLLQYYGDNRLRHGFQVASPRLQIGTQVEVTRNFRFAVSVGDSSNFAVGFNRENRRAIQNDFFSRVEMIFNTTFGRWNLFIQGGRRDVALLGPESEINRGSNNAYIMFGVVGEF